MPERSILREQDQDYINELIGTPSEKVVAIEAGVGNGWYRFLSKDDIVISQEEFGASAPGNEVASHFGFDADKIVSNLTD